MIKHSLKKFFGNLIYVFVPMGIVYLFIVAALILAAGRLIGATSEMLTTLTALVSETVDDSEVSVTEFVTYAMNEIDWGGGFFHTLSQLLDPEWIKRTVYGFFDVLNVSSDTFSGRFAEVTAEFSGTVKLVFSMAVAWISTGIILADVATRFILRRKNARYGPKKWLIANLVFPGIRLIAFFAVVALSCWLRYFTLLLLFVCLSAYGFVALISAWILHGRKVVACKEIVNGKNIVRYLVSAAIVIVAAAVVLIPIFFVNTLIALLVAVPLVLYAVNIISVNADSYVMECIAARKAEEQS